MNTTDNSNKDEELTTYTVELCIVLRVPKDKVAPRQYDVEYVVAHALQHLGDIAECSVEYIL